jgi:hypothetical protein
MACRLGDAKLLPHNFLSRNHHENGCVIALIVYLCS